ncbi:murein transglycosylase [Amylibacter marinus]|uniref:peptidoglycan lytic exotransglycosylase n=2 Tax=Amylibacter marinus TaxID=1475483 RepID=A0ABQ5VVR2_9RHOB|nr:murein transglycosylase [Amylibacter marinus]
MASAAPNQTVDFSALPGWAQDDHAAALAVFQKSCPRLSKLDGLSKAEHAKLCEDAKSTKNPQKFFERNFQPMITTTGKDALFTGYFEPAIPGSRSKTSRYVTPIYRKPPEVKRGQQYKTRREIQNGALEGRGLEIAWIEDPVDAFFLHVQGSGRIKLENGEIIRVGFAGRNGHKYRSVGMEMVRRNILPKSQASAGRIKAWVKKNPKKGMDILAHNRSYIFFQEIETLSENQGPNGAIQVSLTAGRSVAVDPAFNPLGLPVFIDKQGGDPFRRLMVAQDVGTAVKGPQRADIFYGSGRLAGKIAGRTKSGGKLYLLMPKSAVAAR